MSLSAIDLSMAWQHLQGGREPQALALLESVLKREPEHAEALKMLAMVHGAHGRLEEARGLLVRAQRSAPKAEDVAFMLGNVCVMMQRWEEAVEAMRAAVEINPLLSMAWESMAKSLIAMNRFDEAAQVFAEFERRAGDRSADPYIVANTALLSIGRADEAAAVLRRGLARYPSHSGLAMQLATTVNYLDMPDAADELEVHRRAGELLAAQSRRAAAPFANSRDPERRLTVAFFSSDLCAHVCSLFIMPLLARLDRAKVRPLLYMTGAEPDIVTQTLAQFAEYRDCARLDAANLAAAARADGVDILIECNGHTRGQRLADLVPRIAPVQMTYLGYPNTTGLPTIDYRIVDWRTDPEGAERYATEKLLRVPGCFLCFAPQEYAPPVTPSDAVMKGEGPITFGSFNRFTKIGRECIAAWGRLLRETPGTRLMLKSLIVTREMQEHYDALFAAHGVEKGRIVLNSFVHDPVGHLAAYNLVDIGLDAFPYNGTTTTCEAAWMGVPVVTLAGSVHRARVGVTLNTALGLPELIARDVDDYVRIASGLAADRARLRELKLGLRNRMATSELTNATAHAAGFEQVLRSAWRAWCGAGGA